ncbi:transcriptional regulator [Aquabacterium sp. A3]|uniref:transcriptional regulator n=1 Tax=Aquabacterium sp. A3 TaxID=3132829 RepID=UPI00311923D0
MTLTELIEQAAARAGSHGELAKLLDRHQTRLSEWKKGKQKPDAHEVAFMAELAGLPVLETVAEIEAQLDERYAAVWRSALGKLKAAGVAAGAVLILGTMATPEKANAGAHLAHHQKQGAQYTS